MVSFTHMMDGEVSAGQNTAWTLLEKLGEGDAGEVYRVQSLLGDKFGILKRPVRSAFTGDVARQSGQIRAEGQILQAVASVLAADPGCPLRVPAVLDQSRPGFEFGDRLFLVMEPATGFDLDLLARASRMGLSAEELAQAGLSPTEQYFVRAVGQAGRIPPRILIRALQGIFELFEKIHHAAVSANGQPTWGILWNDVKPDHLFWDAAHSQLTIIDWGNSRFLEEDGASTDRQVSRADDYRQLVDQMGRFMEQYAPELRIKIGWPERLPLEQATLEGTAELRVGLRDALIEENQGLLAARQAETELLDASQSEGEQPESALQRLADIHHQILGYGEIPDITAAQRFAAALASRLVQADRLEDVQTVCTWAAELPTEQHPAWQLAGHLITITGRSQGSVRQACLAAIQAAVCDDMPACLWHLLTAVQAQVEPEWWPDLTDLIRERALAIDAVPVRPQLAMNRFHFRLQATARELEDRLTRQGVDPATDGQLVWLREQIRRLREGILPGWINLEPDPPYAGLPYTDVDELLDEIGGALPEDRDSLQGAFRPPKQQAARVLQAWEQQDWLAASQELRELLVWDPDRRRVLRAERALQGASAWLARIHQGPAEGASLLDYVTDLEFSGRELRNALGPAAWLDLVLDGLARLRKGHWPADLVAADPRLAHELPWLTRYERTDRPIVPAVAPSQLAAAPAEVRAAPSLAPAPAVAVTEPPPPEQLPLLHGIREAELGPNEEVALTGVLDAWIPEARGSSARVYAGTLRLPGQTGAEVALKLMRMDKVDYALPLFQEEVRVLNLMKDVPGVNRMLECGFLRLHDGAELPGSANGGDGTAGIPTGVAMRIGADSPQVFLDALSTRIQDGWIPYLALELRDPGDNLIYHCDAGLTNGKYRPVPDLLYMAIQICDILTTAHQRNIVYRDHKILHYYWLPDKNGVYLIDWNVARLHPQGLSDQEIHMDLVQFGARGLHHILTGRTAPGALPLGPTRPEEIEQAAQSYQAQWTYDDQRLSGEVRAVLEQALAGQYHTAPDLARDLKQAYMRF